MNTLISKRKTGLNISGYINSEFGLGESVRSLIHACEKANVPFVLNNFTRNFHRKNDSTYTNFTSDNPHAVNLVHINPDLLELFIQDSPPEYFIDKYNIGYWYWELTELPEKWQQYLSVFDEIWTGSKYIASTLQKYSQIPVKVIGPSVSEPVFSGTPAGEYFPANKFTFLFVFDFSSTMERKNPHKAIEAFRQAFPDQGNVQLVIKSTNADASPDKKQALLQLIGEDSRIFLIDQVLNKQDMHDLMSAADCYVSLHAAEGFGLTMAEAMVLAKPVIATGYSANLDFMNEGNSYLVDYKLANIADENRVYPLGAVWAAPDTGHCAKLMREIYANQSLARKKGRQARKDILQKYNALKVGRDIKARLAEVQKETRGFSFENARNGKKLKNWVFTLLRSEGHARQARAQAEVQFNMVANSMSWRITAPLRRVAAFVRSVL